MGREISGERYIVRNVGSINWYLKASHILSLVVRQS